MEGIFCLRYINHTYIEPLYYWFDEMRWAKDMLEWYARDLGMEVDDSSLRLEPQKTRVYMAINLRLNQKGSNKCSLLLHEKKNEKKN